MNRIASNPAYPPHRPSPVERDLRRPAPWISLSPFRFHAIVTVVSPKRDRDFTKSVTV